MITPALLHSIAKSKDFALLRDRLNQLKSGKLIEGDNALQRWDALRRDYDTQNVLLKQAPSAKTKAPESRDEDLQRSVSIPKLHDVDADAADEATVVSPDDEF